MKKPLPKGVVVFLVGALLLVLSQSVFVMHQVEQGLVIFLGKPSRPITAPGIHFKVPFVERLYTFEKRVLIMDQESQEVLSADKKNLKVDNYTSWRIVDPLVFFRTVRSEEGAVQRLNDIIYSNLREVFGQYKMMEIVSGAREDLMQKMRDGANERARQYGIEIVDVRIKRTDLPPENSKAVFRRMQTERERQAKQYRAQGEEEAVKVRAKADRERAVILADSYQESQRLRGEGDAEAARIYAEAYQVDPQFFRFRRTLEAYQRAFSKDTTLVVEPSGFFRLFGQNPEMDQ
ncbi:MAG: protease modulator HflC [Magnetococcales bacterium]|nr:protease modulator HflC [Magnetococcales bacterium]MBF0156960.1 protease modulator HflC [Magnetococcales bacterium]